MAADVERELRGFLERLYDYTCKILLTKRLKCAMSRKLFSTLIAPMRVLPAAYEEKITKDQKFLANLLNLAVRRASPRTMRCTLACYAYVKP
ncbi:hypothetical protein ANCCEY_02450 [Ancylostoma ceylanicum]|uniref:Uncharacterized protein n=1 Tax=Ancylostoma ceylanicum TaxID=53326 RepID=A0A0D6M2M9_9BILA|nr:hypothetical protein ANCCEY_02450 [Ancylostoma ceylanicum]